MKLMKTYEVTYKKFGKRSERVEVEMQVPCALSRGLETAEATEKAKELVKDGYYPTAIKETKERWDEEKKTESTKSTTEKEK